MNNKIGETLKDDNFKDQDGNITIVENQAVATHGGQIVGGSNFNAESEKRVLDSTSAAALLLLARNVTLG